MEQKDIVLIGASGLGQEVLWLINEINDCSKVYNVLGFIDKALEMHGKIVYGIPVLGDDQWLIDYPKEICAVICVGKPHIRKAIYERIKSNPQISFTSIVARDLKCSDSNKIGQGCIISFSNVLTVNVSLGDFVIINYDCTIGHDAILDNYVTLYPKANIGGNTYIGACTEMGSGSNIIQGKSVGENTIIGASSLVIKDIPAHCTAVGAPAAPIKYHD